MDLLAGRNIRAFLFDLDGVLTPTADVHMLAWSRLFSPYLEAHGAAPYEERDYFDHIDGKPRFDGVTDLLASRGIELAPGTPDADPADDTVWGLGNRKNAVFNDTIATDGVRPYPATMAFLDAVQDAGYEVAVVSSSKNAPMVLAAAGIADRFEVVVDGNVAATLGLAGKPAPDTYIHAAKELGLTVLECAVVEDAVSGVQAGARGAFGLVIGVDRGVGRRVLLDAGADVVVAELDELLPTIPAADDDGGPARLEEHR
ncbi:MAG: HAD-IA family hydrolase [Leifsonia sp.]